ncbi:MAG TPA: glycoside hydrolase family 9 protein, partial [Verrucomicrobiales bacterium]|nr:glycoside hydrolase family 9 protein [Verrucomicrobiales bacterium]
ERAYENNVLPDKGDPQVVSPKNTAATAAAVAALAQTASSPLFKRQFPGPAALYLERARKGWAFLQNAIAKNGRDGSYQKITHYGDTFMHDDELAWAATEMFLATGDESIHQKLVAEFDPVSPAMKKWSWVRLFESCGCAIRSYAFAAASGRVAAAKLNTAHLQKCRAEILAWAAEQRKWAAASAYGTSFPDVSKRFRTAGWYFSSDALFDILTGDVLQPDTAALPAMLSNLNYEGGTNPNNVNFLTGLGWKRQREIVHQYALNDSRVLPPSGIPIGNMQEGFMYLEPYKKELGTLTFPSDGDRDHPYPFYDRWADSFNVTTEFVAVNQARALAGLAGLMARTPLKTQPWRAAKALITGVPARVAAGVPVAVRLEVEGLDTANARIVWESAGMEPVFGKTYTCSPATGAAWIEAEAQWPDGRRAFARVEFEVTAGR